MRDESAQSRKMSRLALAKEIVGLGAWFFVIAIGLLIASRIVTEVGIKYKAQIDSLSDPLRTILQNAIQLDFALLLCAAGFGIAGVLAPTLALSLSKSSSALNQSVEAGLLAIGHGIQRAIAGGDTLQPADSIRNVIRLSDLSRDEYQDIHRRVQRKRFKDLDEESWRYFETVDRRFLELIYDMMPVFRQDYHTVIDLFETQRGELDGDGEHISAAGYLRWKQTTTYRTKTFPYLRSFSDPIVTTASSFIDDDMLSCALKHYEFSVEVRERDSNGRQIAKADIKRLLSVDRIPSLIDDLRRGEPLSIEDETRSAYYTIKYKGGVLSVAINIPCELCPRPVWVCRREKSLIRRDDNYYHHVLLRPSVGIRTTMNLGYGLSNWSILDPTMAPEQYPQEPQPTRGGGVESLRDSPQDIIVFLPDWVLPGIAMAIEWRYPLTDKIFQKTLGDRG